MALGGSGPRRYAEALLDIATEERAVPAYRLRLGTDRSTVPRAVRALLEHVEHS